MKPLTVLALLLIAMPLAAAEPDYTSTKERGSVSILPDAALAEGRLVIRIAAKNLVAQATDFGASAVSISTIDGRPVALVPLEQLISETRAAAQRAKAAAPRDTNVYSHDDHAAMRDSAGNVVGGNWGGAGGASNGIQSYDARDESHGPAVDVETQIAALRAGLLPTRSLARGEIASGQVVTEKLKFKSREQRSLRVVIQLNGEEHSFVVPVPREMK